MSHGAANTTTLYDAQGNKVQVRLVDNEYRLVTHDPVLHDKMDEILVALHLLIKAVEAQNASTIG